MFRVLVWSSSPCPSSYSSFGFSSSSSASSWWSSMIIDHHDHQKNIPQALLVCQGQDEVPTYLTTYSSSSWSSSWWSWMRWWQMMMRIWLFSVSPSRSNVWRGVRTQLLGHHSHLGLIILLVLLKLHNRTVWCSTWPGLLGITTWRVGQRAFSLKADVVPMIPPPTWAISITEQTNERASVCILEMMHDEYSWMDG